MITATTLSRLYGVPIEVLRTPAGLVLKPGDASAATIDSATVHRSGPGATGDFRLYVRNAWYVACTADVLPSGVVCTVVR